MRRPVVYLFIYLFIYLANDWNRHGYGLVWAASRNGERNQSDGRHTFLSGVSRAMEDDPIRLAPFFNKSMIRKIQTNPLVASK